MPKNTPMKQTVLAAIMILALFNLQAQEIKNLVVDANAEVRNVTGFSAIDVSGSIDLYISQGSEEAVAISASSDEIKARIKTEVRNGTLYIFLDAKGLNWKKWGNNKMKGYITFKNLTSIEASGASNVRSTEAIKENELKMEMSGASDFSGEVVVNKLRLIASGSSDIKISGTATDVSIDASGACNIKGYDLKTDMCKVDASGGSNIRITVNKELNSIANGGSTIFYKGTGLIRNISSSGGASIKRKSDD